MTLTLELPNNVESRLESEAAQQGLSLAQYALKVLSEPKPMTTNEILAYWEREGLFNCIPGKGDSAKLARRIRKKAERRTRG